MKRIMIAVTALGLGLGPAALADQNGFADPPVAEPVIDGIVGPFDVETLVPIEEFPIPVTDYALTRISTVWPLCRIEHAPINIINHQVVINSPDECVLGTIRLVSVITYNDGTEETIIRDLTNFCRLHATPIALHPAQPFTPEHYPVLVVGALDPHNTVVEFNEDNNTSVLDIAAYRRENCV